MNILPSPEASPLSNEEFTKLRHKLEDNIIDFFKMTSAISDRELEILISKLIDVLNHDDDKISKQLRLFKLKLLQQYDLSRKSGRRKYKFYRRAFDAHDSKSRVNYLLNINFIPKKLLLQDIPSDEGIDEILNKYSS